ncbi:hypothetical protein DIPPA_09727 [Diplonema papillatum]|nr:hypothetical protein DIPPA_09727 [Diplonema papillatum]
MVKAAVQVEAIEAPGIVGAFSQITGRKRSATVVCRVQCEWLVLSQRALWQAVAQLPAHAKERFDAAVGLREGKCTSGTQSLTQFEKQLASTPVIKECLAAAVNGEALLSALMSCRGARRVPPGGVIVAAGTACAAVWALGRGEALLKAGDAERAHTQSLTQFEKQLASTPVIKECLAAAANGEALLSALMACRGARRVPPGGVIVAAGTACAAVWALGRGEALLKAGDAERPSLTQFEKQLASTPVIKECLAAAANGEALLSVLMACRGARRVPPGGVIVAAGTACAAVWALGRGEALLKAGDAERPVTPGETLGFTCGVPHLWAATAVAVDDCLVWEIACEKAKECFSAHGVASVAAARCRGLLQGEIQLPRGWKRPYFFPLDHGCSSSPPAAPTASSASLGLPGVDRTPETPPLARVERGKEKERQAAALAALARLFPDTNGTPNRTRERRGILRAALAKDPVPSLLPAHHQLFFQKLRPVGKLSPPGQGPSLPSRRVKKKRPAPVSRPPRKQRRPNTCDSASKPPLHRRVRSDSGGCLPPPSPCSEGTEVALKERMAAAAKRAFSELKLRAAGEAFCVP